jgi:hypothetical protein
MAVLDWTAGGAGAGTNPKRFSLIERLAAIDDDLHAAVTVLAADIGDSHGEAIRRLRDVEDALLALACAATTEPGTAARLVDVRDDLSSYLLAASVVAEASTGTRASTEVMRRAVEATRTSLQLITG